MGEELDLAGGRDVAADNPGQRTAAHQRASFEPAVLTGSVDEPALREYPVGVEGADVAIHPYRKLLPPDELAPA